MVASMKKCLTVLTMIALTGIAHAQNVVDGVAAIVNDKVITYSEIQEFVQPLLPQLRRSFSGTDLVEAVRKAQLDALNTLIERALILHEFKKKGYILPENAVDNQITDIIANDYNNDRSAFVKSLETQNMTLSQFREKVRERIIVQAMANRKRQEQLFISPFKMEQYYKTHLEDFKIPDQIKLRMLVIKRTPNPGATGPVTDDPRRRLAEEIHSKLKAGDSFESLAKLYSEGSEKEKGGDWGWVGRDSLRQELNAIAFALKAGEHSGVIETPDGFYILFVEDVKVAHVQPLAAVRDEIEKILLEEQRSKMQEDWVKQLRAKAYIKMF
jgi:parvulin-like peptidyl-prolyl isomerase